MIWLWLLGAFIAGEIVGFVLAAFFIGALGDEDERASCPPPLEEGDEIASTGFRAGTRGENEPPGPSAGCQRRDA